jgi:hypothetical protein
MDNNAGIWGCLGLVLAAIITGVFLLIANRIIVIGDNGTPTPLAQVQSSPAAEPTASIASLFVQPTETVPPSPPSPMPYPTDTSNPTSTAIADTSPPPVTDTPAGTILEVGQTWRQGGLELAVNDTFLLSIGVGTRMSLINRKPHAVSFRYTVGDVASAVDNLGRNLKVSADNCYGHSLLAKPQEFVLEVDHTRKGLYYRGCEYAGVFIDADTADPSLTEIVVRFTGISSIMDARWRIPIYH